MTFKLPAVPGTTFKLLFRCGETTIKNRRNLLNERKLTMEFLKELLGEELYAQVEAKINEHNGLDANKDKQIKLANLATGEYVAKGKFDGISAELSSKTSELEKANSLIEEMKKASKGNEDMQGKISEYETQVTALQKELLEIKLSNAVKVALLSENAADVDYLTYKLNEKLSAEGKTLELDDNGSIKGIDGELTALKTAYPNMFVKGNNDGYTVIGDNRLPDTQRNNAMSQAELLKKPYAERVKFYNENPDAYKELMK